MRQKGPILTDGSIFADGSITESFIFT